MGGGIQLALFSAETAQDVTKAEQKISVPGYKRKKKRTHDDWMNNLPVEEKGMKKRIRSVKDAERK